MTESITNPWTDGEVLYSQDLNDTFKKIRQNMNLNLAHHDLRLTVLEVNAGVDGVDDDQADLFITQKGLKGTVDITNTTSIFGYNLQYRNDLTTTGDLTNLSSIIQSKYLYNESVRVCYGLFFSTDGRYLYLSDYTQHYLHQYYLSTPWDFSTMKKIAKLGLNAATGTYYFKQIYISPDGFRLYTINHNSDNIHQFALASPWMIQSATMISNKSISNEETTPYALTFSDDGTKAYIGGSASDSIHEYTLSTPWDITTLSYSKSKSLGFDVHNIQFTNKGKTLYVKDSTNTIYKYSLSTPWDISTITQVASGSISNVSGSTTSFYIRDDEGILLSYSSGYYVQKQTMVSEGTPSQKEIYLNFTKSFNPSSVYLAVFDSQNDMTTDEIGDVTFELTDGTNTTGELTPFEIHTIALPATPTKIIIHQKDTAVSKIAKYVLLLGE